MKKFIHFYFIASFVLLAPVIVNAQQKFYATISPKAISKDEFTTLRVVIENTSSISELKLPDLSAFNIVSGPIDERGMSTVNGNSTSYIARSYVLQPKRSGNFSLAPIEATLDGKLSKTNPLSVAVTNAAGNNKLPQTSIPQTTQPMFGSDPFQKSNEVADIKPGENIQEKIAKNMQLKLEIDKQTVYAGEPVLATYNLYTRVNSETNFGRTPAYNGFSVVDFPEQLNLARTGTLNGKPCNVYTVRKSQLYPMQAGSFKIDELTLDNVVSFRKTGNNGMETMDDFFREMAGANIVSQNVTLSSKPVSITVKPLPANAPTGFSGAVGNFSINTSLQNTSFASNENGVLNITISGAGNMMLITQPEVQWPTGFDVFDAKLTDELNKETIPVSGTKLFSIPFTVFKPGSYAIPPISFSFFDPKTGKYQTAKSAQLSFTVLPAKPVAPLPDTSSFDKKSMVTKVLENRPVWLSIIAIIAITALFFGLKRKSKKEVLTVQTIAPTDPETERLGKIAEETFQQQKNPLEETEACLNAEPICTDYYNILNRELKKFLSAKFDVSQPQISSKTVAKFADQVGVDIITSQQLVTLLQEIEWKLFTPIQTDANQRQDYSDAHLLVQKINDCCKKNAV